MSEEDATKFMMKFDGVDEMDARDLAGVLSATQDLFDAIADSHGVPRQNLKVTGIHSEPEPPAGIADTETPQ